MANGISPRTIEIVESAPTPAHRYVADLSVEVIDAEVDESSTASLQLTFEYGGDQGQFLEFPFFVHGSQPAPSHKDTPGLLLLPSGDLDREDDCWKLPDQDRLGSNAAMPGYRFDQGEELRVEAYVWADHRYEACFDPGEYRFEETFSFEGEQYTWGFRLRVSDV